MAFSFYSHSKTRLTTKLTIKNIAIAKAKGIVRMKKNGRNPESHIF